MTTERQEIFKKLNKHSWYTNTEATFKEELINLPDDYDAFLLDLSERPDEIGELDVLKLVKIGYGKYLILVVFEVRSNITNQIFTFEYSSWRMGKNPGARGIIFLETNDIISHFIVLKSHKFSTAEEVLDSVGGLYLQFYKNQLTNLPKKIENEIRFHLGIDKLEFKKIYDLGRCHPDYGMSNNQSELFAATIDITHLPNLVVKDDFRVTHKPVGIEIKIVPISELSDYVLNKIEDNYFLSAISRVLVHPDFNIPL